MSLILSVVVSCFKIFYQRNCLVPRPLIQAFRIVTTVLLNILCVVRFYRYAFKLTYDEAVLGEVTNEDELVEYLTEYDRDWYLGSETDRDWQTSILADKPFLFSLGRDKSQVGKICFLIKIIQHSLCHRLHRCSVFQCAHSDGSHRFL